MLIGIMRINAGHIFLNSNVMVASLREDLGEDHGISIFTRKLVWPMLITFMMIFHPPIGLFNVHRLSQLVHVVLIFQTHTISPSLKIRES